MVIFKREVGEFPGLGKWGKLYGSVMLVTACAPKISECCRHVACPADSAVVHAIMCLLCNLSIPLDARAP